MDVIQLYVDYSVSFQTEGHKHCRPGWVNTSCPFCTGNEGLHLGYNLSADRFVCWRCGGKSIPQVLSKLLSMSYVQAEEVSKQYGNTSYIQYKAPKIHIQPHKLPSNTMPLEKIHRKYLESRGFDPDYIEKEWAVLGTGPVSTLSIGKGSEKKTIVYKHRIVIPFYWNGEQVSFDTRDVTGKAQNKYQACPKEREYIPHKDIIYCKQEKLKSKLGIAVEGPTDVWRFGPRSFATSGIKFTPRQVRLIAKSFVSVAVVFDGPSETSQEQEAENQAILLVNELRYRGCDAFRVKIDGDPGGMSQSEANYIVKDILKYERK
jgi:hypothetical protein